MTYDRAAIMKAAWALARRERGWTEAHDWTPGPRYGTRRPVTPAERRVLFAECLRRAWAGARFRIAAQRRFLAAQTAEGRALHAEIDAIENRDGLRWADLRRLDTLRHQIEALAGPA